jgi:uncharacterized membrane protein
VIIGAGAGAVLGVVIANLATDPGIWHDVVIGLCIAVGVAVGQALDRR